MVANNEADVFNRPPEWIPSEITFDSYFRIMNGFVVNILYNSILIAFLAAIIAFMKVLAFEGTHSPLNKGGKLSFFWFKLSILKSNFSYSHCYLRECYRCRVLRLASNNRNPAIRSNSCIKI